MVGVVLAAGIEAGKSVFVKRDQAPLLDSPSPEGAKVQSLKWGKEYTVKKVDGNWAEISVDAKSGWVYKGNLTDQEPDETGNKNSFSSYLESIGIPVIYVKGNEDLAKTMVSFVYNKYKPRDKETTESEVTK